MECSEQAGGYTPDRRLTPHLVALAGCVETKLKEAKIVTCYGGITSGDGVDLSEIGDSGAMWWINVGNVTVGNADGTRSSKPSCRPTWYVNALVGYATCYPVNEDGTAMDEKQQLTLSSLVNAAMMALYRAVACCDWQGDYGVGEVVVTTWTPQGPMGGVLGGQWSVQIQILGNRPEPQAD